MANTTMDVIAAAVRDIIAEPLTGGATDGAKYPNATILRDVNRAVKLAVGIRKGVKAWFAVATTAGVKAYSLSTLGLLQVERANYQGQPLQPITTFEKDVAVANGQSYGGVMAYSLDGDPPLQITLLDAPTVNGTTDLQVYALYFPTSVSGLTSGSSLPLPPYYDEYIIQETAALLTQGDPDSETWKKCSAEAADIAKMIASIEEPRIKDPQGDRIYCASEFKSGEMDGN